MRFVLHHSRLDGAGDYSVRGGFRFAVVDLDKAKSYPLNFVCMLPAKINPNVKSNSVFLQVFGDKSMEQAKALLTEALATEEDSELRLRLPEG
jgi:hypothetical protein